MFLVDAYPNTDATCIGGISYTLHDIQHTMLRYHADLSADDDTMYAGSRRSISARMLMICSIRFIGLILI